MVLRGGEAKVEARLVLFVHSANLDARKVRDLCRMYHRLRNRLGHA
jgi:hypothetical protein